MVDLSRLMQDAAILEVIEQSADECRTLSAQNSYQAMRIEELERKLSEARAELETVKRDYKALLSSAEREHDERERAEAALEEK